MQKHTAPSRTTILHFLLFFCVGLSFVGINAAGLFFTHAWIQNFLQETPTEGMHAAANSGILHAVMQHVFIGVVITLVVVSAIGAWFIARLSSRRAAAERELVASEKKYRHLVEHAPDAVVIHDGQTILFANQAAAELVKAGRPEEIIGRSVAAFVHPDCAPVVIEAMEKMLSGGGDVPLHEEIYLCLDGSSVTVEVAATTVHFHDRAVIQLVARDISLRKKMEAELTQLAHFDTLTGLPNRTLFFDRLEHAIREARRNKKRCALLYLDLDGFKEINDTHGHAAGDALLSEAAQRMHGCIRETDTVARLGGDEFAVVITNMDTHHDATRVAEEIILTINEPFCIHEKEHDIGVSIGVAVFPDHSHDSHELLRHADHAMYHIKRKGKNNVGLFEKKVHDAQQKEELDIVAR